MSRRHSRASVVLTLVAMVAFTGCNNYLKRADGDRDEQGRAALLVEYKTRFGEQSDNLLSAALNASTSGVLEEVGKEALPKIQDLLGSWGYVTDVDEEIGRGLRDETLLGGGVPAVISGMWVHPSTANLSSDNTLVGRTFHVEPSTLAEKVAETKAYPALAFVSIEFWDDSVLSVARWSRAVVRVAVTDKEGEVVLDAAGEGSGPTGFLFPDRSKGALLAAIDDALGKLKTMAPERL